MSRILVLEPRQRSAEWWNELAGEGHDIVVHHDPWALLDVLVVDRPELLVYVLGQLTIDHAVLSVLRRADASLPIILLGGPADLEARRSIQDLKPTYYGVLPLDPSELMDAVRGALDHRRAISS